MSAAPHRSEGTAAEPRRRGGRAAALGILFLACACPEPTPAPAPASSSSEPSLVAAGAVPAPRELAASPHPAPTSRNPSAPRRALDAAALAALHLTCPADGCPEGLSCVRYCGFAGCRPGSIFHTCELPCPRGEGCPDGFTCGTVADGPGQVCEETERRPGVPVLPDSLDR